MRKWFVGVAAVVFVAGLGIGQDRSPQTEIEAALARLMLEPRDPYLQFVVLQLARRAGELPRYLRQVEQLAGSERERREADLFDLFTGAHAVQESLQLDTMRRGGSALPPLTTDIASLEGPAVRSHPWTEMLAGRKPPVSELSRSVPIDFWLVEFASVNKLLEVAEAGDLWGTHLAEQSLRSARAFDLAERVRRQLAIETTPLLRPFYDQVVAGIAMTGSDLYLREGSDLTLVFKLKIPELFRAQMNKFLDKAAERPGAKRGQGECLGVAYDQVATADREVSVFAAWPAKDLHVRSNSRPALERVLASIQGKGPRLGDSDEHAYVRTLMPLGASEEDGFVYLSDPFVRRIVGPQVKLCEQRRLVCYNHLRMIGHAALLYRTEQGKAAGTLADLIDKQALPPQTGDSAMHCPEGGDYALAGDWLTGTCSKHGHAHFLTPCLELPVTRAREQEATDYTAFVNAYNQYWRTYFDPIALRIAASRERYRAETIVLPLIDNTVYTALAMSLGEPAPLDDHRLAARCIFSVVLQLDRERLFAQVTEAAGGGDLGLTPADVELLRRGLGSRVGLHVCDAEPMFDFSLPRFFGAMLGSFRGRSSGIDEDVLIPAFLVTALNAPVYASFAIDDAEAADAFLQRVDALLARQARKAHRSFFWDLEVDYYRVHGEEKRVVRSASVGFGPLKWRLFWARIGQAVHVASKSWILDEIAQGKPPAHGPTGQAMLRLRPGAWQAVKPDYELGWAENARWACLANLAPLASVARAAPELAAPEVLGLASRAYGVRFFCPEAGRYEIGSAEARDARCSVHGSLGSPAQAMAPAAEGELGRLLRQFAGMTATLTLQREGLRAVVEIERRQ